jgi:hypothetical protein
MQEERGEDDRSDRHHDRHEREVVVSSEDAHHDQDEADPGEDRSERVERPVRIGVDGVDDAAAQPEDDRDDQGLEKERCPPADGGGDEAPDQRARCGADATHPGDDPEGPGPRGDVGEQQRGEDVDRRDQQRGANPFEYRVADDQYPETGGDRAYQRADTVDKEADREASFAAPAVRELAPGDHQRSHHQQESRDRDLDTLHRGVKVFADVGDHDVHVRAREAADELRQGERNEDLPQGTRRPPFGGASRHVGFTPRSQDSARDPSSSRRMIRAS